MKCDNCVFCVGGQCINLEALRFRDHVKGCAACRDFAAYDRKKVSA